MTDLFKGQPVQVQPGSALWTSGARFGEIVAIRTLTRKQPEKVLVKLDNHERMWLARDLILEA